MSDACVAMTKEASTAPLDVRRRIDPLRLFARRWWAGAGQSESANGRRASGQCRAAVIGPAGGGLPGLPARPGLTGSTTRRGRSARAGSSSPVCRPAPGSSCPRWTAPDWRAAHIRPVLCDSPLSACRRPPTASTCRLVSTATPAWPFSSPPAPRWPGPARRRPHSSCPECAL
ncbi:unnamed protein product [Protopolystoma xenopodis]|uniref:Uncharacterized protein n=1 Tax=Protopolystoma xenopodis TaxID=117903 RepID=A0A3S5BBD3_9PLAT|nr:unnamed protein product [Protopolystoma xenopodis]